MKNIKLFFISIAGIALLMNSCKRNENINPSTSSHASQITKKSLIVGDSITQDSCANFNFLKFRDKEAFINTLSFLSDNSMTSDSILMDFEANFAQTTLRDVIEQTSSNDSIKIINFNKITKVLASVVSADSIIQIDSLAFLFDFENEKIYEMYPVTCANLTLLKQKQEVNEDSIYIFEYNFHDPIFHPSGYEEYSGKFFRWLKKVFGGCEEIWAAPANNTKFLEYTVYINSTTTQKFSFIASHWYRKYAVYFEIKHEWDHYSGSLSRGTPYAVPIAFSHQDNWKRYCGAWGGNSNWPNSTYGNNAYFTFKTYKSTNSLARNKNQVKSYLWFHLPGTPISPMQSPHSVYLDDLNF